MRHILFLLAILPLLAFGELEWKKTTIDYQAKPEDESVTAIYYFVNSGDKPVEIMDTKTSCGCTAAELEKRAYAPGEMGELKVTFKFEGRTGHQIKTIQVYTDERETPLYVLTLEVDIPMFIAIEPELIFWSLNETPKPKSTVVTVMSKEPVQIVSAKADNEEMFKTELTALDEGRRYRVTVTPTATTASANSKVTLVTNVGKEKPREAYIVLQVY